MSKTIVEFYRIYANAFEIAVQDEDTEEFAGGWSDIIKQDTDLLAKVIHMVKNQENDEGRKLAVLLCKHKKTSVKWIANKIMLGEKFDIIDRSNIEL